MTVKKIGKAQADPEKGLWGVEAKSDRFTMNQRMVDTRSDVKALRAVYSRHAGKRPPSVRRSQQREEHFLEQKRLKTELKKLITQVYAEIFKESFSYPIPLRKDRDYDHRSDWRFCLYQGMIYQFDRPDYREDEMVQQITEALRKP